MTNTFEPRGDRASRRQGSRVNQGKLARGLVNTIPIVLAGSMAMQAARAGSGVRHVGGPIAVIANSIAWITVY